VALGRKLKAADEGHAVIARLARGDATALSALGIDDYPRSLDPSMREWALVEGRDGFVVYVGVYDEVGLPSDVRVLAHSHPGPDPRAASGNRVVKDLPGGAAGLPYSRIVEDLAVARAAAIIPSVNDIHVISDGGTHVLYTRYVHVGDGQIANPGDGAGANRVALHLRDTKVVRWNERTKEYWYEVSVVVKDASGAELWSGKMYAVWYAIPRMGDVFVTRPERFGAPLQTGWQEP
jgi:hypothetical protein